MRVTAQATRFGVLQPAAHGDLVIQVLDTESPLEVPFFSGYDYEVHEGNRTSQRAE